MKSQGVVFGLKSTDNSDLCTYLELRAQCNHDQRLLAEIAKVLSFGGTIYAKATGPGRRKGIRITWNKGE